ncbi:MAG: protein TolQ [Parvibaculales bacterium]
MDTVTFDQATQLAATDFSLWALFIRADIVVKLVMIGLIVASVMSWSIIIEKIMTYRRVRQQAEEFEALFWSGETLQNIYRQLASGEASPSVRVFNAAMREWVRHDSNRRKTEAGAIIPSIERALTNAVAREMEALESRLLFLATVGAVAPFVGLFGTVWGIMNSFQAIAMSRDTNLAVVAPGIAEALFATGLGLLAAIPAVVAYNACAASVQRFASRLDHFADDFINLMARQNTPQSKG